MNTIDYSKKENWCKIVCPGRLPFQRFYACGFADEPHHSGREYLYCQSGVSLNPTAIVVKKNGVE